jgi:HK97 family phage portal protein
MSLLRRDPPEAPTSELVIRDRRAAHTLEVRDPRGATTRTGWTAPGRVQIDEWNAEQAFRFGYAANVIAYRCVQIRATAASKIPLVAGRRKGDASTIVDNARITQLLGPPPGGPSPRLSARKLFRWTYAQKIVTGRRAWEIETDANGNVVAFWPLASAHLKAVPSAQGSEWFRLFKYGSGPDPVKFKPEDVFFGWDPAGNDFRQAESPLQACRYDLSLVTLCDQHGIGFLRNNAVPAAIVTTTEFPDEASRRAFLQNWQAEFQGPHNAGRVALNEASADGEGSMSDLIDVKVLGLSAKDARLVESRRDAMMEIAIALGVPWSRLDASGRTYANADAEERAFYEETVLEDLTDLEDDINMQLASRLGTEVVWFDLRGVRALRRTKWALSGADVVGLVDRQVILPNEIRAEVDLEPIDGLDEAFAELAATPAPSTPPVSAERSAEPMADQPDPGSQAAAEGHRHPPSAAAETRETDPDAIEQRRARIWRAADTTARAIEARWERVLRRLFAKQQEATLARLTGKRGRQAFGYGLDGLPEQRAPGDPAPQIDPAAVFDPQFWEAQTAEVTADLFDDVTTQALNRLAVQLDIAFDLEAPYVRDFIQARANQLAGNVTSTTYEAIQAALSEGVAAGESIDDLATRIRNVFSTASDSRARMIARTEVISASNGAAVLGASQLPADVVAAQEWIATRDGRVRPEHAAVDGQVAPIGTPFTVAGTSLAYPGDPSGPADQVIQCRCTVAFITPEEYAEMVAVARSQPRVEVRQVVSAAAEFLLTGESLSLMRAVHPDAA